MSHDAYDPRCRFSVDDCIWFLRDVSLYAGQSLFENGFLRFWRELHEEYGVKVQFNVYYEDMDTGWNLAQMSERFRDEWLQNAGWMRLTFHARADQPPMPYASATYAAVAGDIRCVNEEVTRFAGQELLSACTTLHWGMTTREGCRALRDNGIEALVGYFRIVNNKPFVAYYLDLDQTTYLSTHDVWYDKEEGLWFVKHDLVLNEVSLSEIVPNLNRVYGDPDQSEILEIMIHEQYFYPRFPHYQPEAAEKVRLAAEWVRSHGYRYAFYEDWRVLA